MVAVVTPMMGWGAYVELRQRKWLEGLTALTVFGIGVWAISFLAPRVF